MPYLEIDKAKEYGEHMMRPYKKMFWESENDRKYAVTAIVNALVHYRHGSKFFHGDYEVDNEIHYSAMYCYYALSELFSEVVKESPKEFELMDLSYSQWGKTEALNKFLTSDAMVLNYGLPRSGTNTFEKEAGDYGIGNPEKFEHAYNINLNWGRITVLAYHKGKMTRFQGKTPNDVQLFFLEYLQSLKAA